MNKINNSINFYNFKNPMNKFKYPIFNNFITKDK